MLWCVEGGGGSGGLEVAGTKGAGLRVTMVTVITVAPPRLPQSLLQADSRKAAGGRALPGEVFSRGAWPSWVQPGVAELPPTPPAVLAPPPSLQFSGRTQGGNLSPCESRSQPRLLPRALPRPGAALPGRGGVIQSRNGPAAKPWGSGDTGGQDLKCEEQGIPALGERVFFRQGWDKAGSLCT